MNITNESKRKLLNDILSLNDPVITVTGNDVMMRYFDMIGGGLLHLLLCLSE